MTKSCLEVVQARLKAKHGEFYLNPALAKECEQDAAELCKAEHAVAKLKDFSSNGKLLECLISKQDKIKRPGCKAQLQRKEKHRVQDVSLDPQAKGACADDRNRFCQAAKKEGRVAVQKCLQQQASRLSVACREKQKVYLTLASKDIRVNVPAQTACKAMLPKFCKGVPEGQRKLTCLVQHQHDQEMDEECAEVLARQQRAWVDFNDIHPWLHAPCRADLQNLTDKGQCPDKSQKGWRTLCLQKHRATATKACKKALVQHQARAVADLRVRAGMAQACRQDLDTHCATVSPGGGRWNKCLQAHDGKLKLACQVMVSELKRASALHASVNLEVRQQCKHELTAFCPQVTEGESRLMACMARHRFDMGFGQPCRDAIDKTANVEQVLARTKGFTPSMQEVHTFMDRHQNIFDRYGGLLLGSTLCFVALVSFALAHCLIRRSLMKRIGYASIGHPDYLES